MTCRRMYKKVWKVLKPIGVIVLITFLFLLASIFYTYISSIPNAFYENLYRVCLSVGALVGLGFAYWRAKCSDTQNNIQNENYTTEKMMTLFRQLNAKDLDERIIAIHLLWRIALNATTLDKLTIIDIFCKYINTNAKVQYNSRLEAFEKAKDIVLILEYLRLYQYTLNIKNSYSFSFANIYLNYMQFCSFNFKNAHFSNVDFTEAAFSDATFTGARIENCNFNRSFLGGIELKRSIISNSFFCYVKFTSVLFENTEINRCNFEKCCFDENAFKKGKIINATFFDCYNIYCPEFTFDKRFIKTTAPTQELIKIDEDIFLQTIEFGEGISFEKPTKLYYSQIKNRNSQSILNRKHYRQKKKFKPNGITCCNKI